METTHTLKTTLVNHSGVIQDKFIIRNTDDLTAYEKINAEQHGERLFHDSPQNEKFKSLVNIVSSNNKESAFVTVVRLAQEKILNMLKYLQQGRVLVVNMNGGYTFWDDSCMSIVSETERSTDGHEYQPKVYIGNHKVLVLENQEEIPVSVTALIKQTLKCDEFSYITRLNTDHNHEIGKWIKQALESGCDTIVAESQLMNPTQIKKLAFLFMELPPMTFLILTGVDLREVLENTIGADKTNMLFKKHAIGTKNIFGNDKDQG